MDLIRSMVILKACFFFSSVLSLLQLMVEEGWLKMLRKRKFRELKTADEEKALSKINTICQKLVFYFCTVAKCNAEQISS